MSVTSLASASPGMLLPAQTSLGGTWLPEAAATSAHHTDPLFVALLVIAGTCLALLGGGIDLFLYRFRRANPAQAGHESGTGRMTTAMLFLLPLLGVFVIFLAGLGGFVDRVVSPRDALEIRVEGRQWNWQFTYPSGFEIDTLHVPAERPVKLRLTSADGLHGLRIPAFRLSQDLLPGRETEAWFTATRPGEYPLLAAAYGGEASGAMNGRVLVHEPAAFDKWLRSAASPLDRFPPIKAGEILTGTYGCTACHSADGTPGVGPTFHELYGSTRTFADGARTVANDDYLGESIIYSTKRVVAGFQPVMPSFQGQIEGRELEAIITYLRSLSEVGREEAAAARDEAATDAADGAAAKADSSAGQEGQ